MESQSAQAFQAYMEEKDMHVSFVDDEGKVARMDFNLDNTDITIHIFFGEDERDVHFEGHDFIRIPEDKQNIVYKVCNHCNNSYRWVKFVWDEEHEMVTVQADAVIEPQTCAEECYEIIGRMCGIVKNAYPLFMKAMWA